MKKLLLALALAAIMVAALAVPAFAADPYSGRQTWQLDQEDPTTNLPYPTVVLPGPFQMEKNGGPGDNGQTGQITVPFNGQAIWIADQVALTDVTFTNGNWVIDLVTDSDWGFFADKCAVEVGQWDGSTFSPLFTPGTVAYSYNYIHVNNPDQMLTGIVEIKVQSGAISIDEGKWLAVRITNNDAAATNGHIIYTGEGDFASCVSSPQQDPGYPVPEMAAGVLLGAGLLGVGGFIFLRRKQASVKA